MTTYYFKMMNMSSGTSILVKSDSLTKYGWNKTMNWETSLVVGRMDPIQNFRNTESKIDIGIEATDIYCFPGESYNRSDFDILNQLLSIDGKQIKKVNMDDYGDEFFRGFFYPSYTVSGNNYAVQTAPIFLCQLSALEQSTANTNTYFYVYATIPSFSYNKDRHVDADGFSYTTQLDFTLNVIHTNIRGVSSKINPLGGS